MKVKGDKITAEFLLREYAALKKKLGRRPTVTEFMLQHNMRRLINAFGKPAWSSLLQAAGEPVRNKTAPDRNQAIKDYLRLKKESGGIPTSAEYAKQYHSLATLRKIFGRYPWHSLLKAAGEKPRFASFVTREILIQDYLDLMKKLGRQPLPTEYYKYCYGVGIINAKFGVQGWIRLQKAAGVEPLLTFDLTAEHLIADFLDLQKKLGRRPKLIEYTYQCHTPKVLDRVFGKPGWNKLIQAVGKKAMPKDILTAEHLIQDFCETCNALKRKPTQEEFRKRHFHTTKVYERVFGRPGFSNLVKAASRFHRY